MRIGAASRLTGLSPATLRYYERAGLLAPPPRRGRVRDYDLSHIVHLRALKAARQSGFGIAELRALAAMPGNTPGRREAFLRRLQHTEADLARLKNQRTLLIAAAACACSDFSNCAVLK